MQSCTLHNSSWQSSMLSIPILHLQDLFCPSIFPLCFTPHLPMPQERLIEDWSNCCNFWYEYFWHNWPLKPYSTSAGKIKTSEISIEVKKIKLINMSSDLWLLTANQLQSLTVLWQCVWAVDGFKKWLVKSVLV